MPENDFQHEVGVPLPTSGGRLRRGSPRPFRGSPGKPMDAPGRLHPRGLARLGIPSVYVEPRAMRAFVGTFLIGILCVAIGWGMVTWLANPDRGSKTRPDWPRSG